VVRFGALQQGVAPGQAVVLYDGSRVVGSATIDRTRRVTAAVR
jgi:tRNA-specific 2-thiouridylase